MVSWKWELSALDWLDPRKEQERPLCLDVLRKLARITNFPQDFFRP